MTDSSAVILFSNDANRIRVFAQISAAAVNIKMIAVERWIWKRLRRADSDIVIVFPSRITPNAPFTERTYRQQNDHCNSDVQSRIYGAGINAFSFKLSRWI